MPINIQKRSENFIALSVDFIVTLIQLKHRVEDDLCIRETFYSIICDGQKRIKEQLTFAIQNKKSGSMQQPAI